MFKRKECPMTHIKLEGVIKKKKKVHRNRKKSKFLIFTNSKLY